MKWTRLSCHDFVDNQVRLQLFVLAYNMGNFLRQAVLPRWVRHWSLTTLREKLIKIGAKVVRHSRQVVFQMAEVAVPRELFRAILQAIERLRLPAAAQWMNEKRMKTSVNTGELSSPLAHEAGWNEENDAEQGGGSEKPVFGAKKA